MAADVPTRWNGIWLAGYPIALGVASLIACTRPHERVAGATIPIVLLTVLAAGGWHYFSALRRPYAHRHTRPMLPWAVVVLPATALLVAMAPVYLFAASFVFAAIFVLLPSRAAMVASLVFSALLVAPLESTLGHTFAMVMFGLGVGSSLLSGFIVEVVEQNRERRQTIAALREAENTISALQRDAGRHEERARIARELHDTVTQDLVGIGLQLDAVAQAAPPELFPQIERVRMRSAGALQDARSLIEAHRPRELASHTLADALATLDRSAHLSDGPTLEVVVDDDVVLRAEDEALLFRVAQEAVTNARKHARASVITVTVSMAGGRVHLDVVDDGVGFDATRAKPSSNDGSRFGLESMKSRVRSARGLLGIESTPGEGTAVHVELTV
jgi:signal transduction histidine kinase